jgi:hypothetical protein
MMDEDEVVLGHDRSTAPTTTRQRQPVGGRAAAADAAVAGLTMILMMGGSLFC